MDPYAILATLGFGVFLFNVIFNLLNNAPAGTGTRRSFDVDDIDIPLAFSDIVSSGDAKEVSSKPNAMFRNDKDSYRHKTKSRLHVIQANMVHKKNLQRYYLTFFKTY